MKVQSQSGSVGPFSMTDEERDIGQFQEYLATLQPDALWDVLSHIDSEHYPRRHEAALREVKRRSIFFIDPYNTRDHLFRSFFSWTVFLSVLALFLHYVGGVYIEIPPGLHLPFFTDLAVGGPKAARILLPVAIPLSAVFTVVTVSMTLQGLWLMRSHRIPGELVGLGALCAAVAGICLALIVSG